jgi:glycopeptide antibiotics resistance protein
MTLNSPSLKLQFEFILYTFVGISVKMFMIIEFEQEIKKNNNKSQFIANKIPFRITTTKNYVSN